MRLLALLLIALVTAACVLPADSMDASTLRYLNPLGAPLERHIFARHTEMAAFNARLGYPQATPIAGHAALRERLRLVISRRISQDLSNIYQRELRPAQKEYLILAALDRHYIVFVVRITDVNGEYYTDLEGLAYRFSAEGAEPQSVSPTQY